MAARRDKKATRWFSIFKTFVANLRIDSKHETSADGRGVELKLWTSQDTYLKEIAWGLERGIRMFLILKSRQVGITTISLAIDLFWLAMHPGIKGALVVDTEENRSVFRQTIDRLMQSFPVGFVGKAFVVVKHNKDFILFSNGSRLDYLVAGTKTKATWGESRGYSFAHISEVSKFGNPAGLASFRESLSDNHPNRLVIYESTANGLNHYRDMWEEFGRDEQTKHRFFLGWWSNDLNRIPVKDQRYEIYGLAPPDHEERELIEKVFKDYSHDVSMEQLAWYRWRMSDESVSDQDMHQNQPWIAEEAFVQSGYSFFHIRLIQKGIERCRGLDGGEPVRYKGFRYYLGEDFFATTIEQIVDQERRSEIELRIWEEPVKDAQYVIGCDPAYGRNDWKDRHSCNVFRCYADKLVQVAEYADEKYETRQAAWVLAHLAGAYKNCLVNIELTGPGTAVFTEFKSLSNMLRQEMYTKQVSDLGWQDVLITARDYLYHRPDSMGTGYAYHTKMSANIKFELLNQFRDSFATNRLVINSVPMLEEMATVVQDGSEIGAPGRNKDDRVFAAVLAHRAWIDWIRAGLVAQQMTYERVTRGETGEATLLENHVDRIVTNFFRRAEEREDDAPIGDTPYERLLSDRGLL